MKTIKFLFSDLNQDERQMFGGIVIFITGAVFLICLVSTVRPPVVDHHPTDYQTYQEASYELSKSYYKYANRIYNEKYSK
ncbi:hypothetical protein UFOVP391_40 [uncultured Caudovirales phage]|uniref:Uncharacterized protein n=1 Tax=uncultured Caudovirales phage TaxID=2100421 RepID=A0A6J7XA39_9CAUD|nr:hypothetical protein UFOVP391_40 [uncultured Caudovirales phage]